MDSDTRYRYAHDVLEADSVDGTDLTYGPDLLLPHVLAWRRAALTADPTFDPYVHDPYDAGTHLQPAPPPADACAAGRPALPIRPARTGGSMTGCHQFQAGTSIRTYIEAARGAR